VARTLVIDLGPCVQCGRCAEVCRPKGAITLDREFETASLRKEDLQVEAVLSGRLPPVEWTAPRVAEEIRRVLGRSLHIRHVDTGSCNGCDWEMTALLNPVHDVQRLGIDFVASPRHADLLMDTGTVSENLRKALVNTYEATPEPRLVVAVGACGVSGGCFADAPASLGGVDQVVPVDVHIPGCPPRPAALIYGLLLATGRLEQKVRRRVIEVGARSGSGAIV
jgi:Ni,Fe-hydrogenase III small subunit